MDQSCDNKKTQNNQNTKKKTIKFFTFFSPFSVVRTSRAKIANWSFSHFNMKILFSLSSHSIIFVCSSHRHHLLIFHLFSLLHIFTFAAYHALFVDRQRTSNFSLKKVWKSLENWKIFEISFSSFLRKVFPSTIFIVRKFLCSFQFKLFHRPDVNRFRSRIIFSLKIHFKYFIFIVKCLERRKSS